MTSSVVPGLLVSNDANQIIAVRHDPRDRYPAAGRVLLVGEMNPYGSRPGFALWDEPEGATGDRLRGILGLSTGTYRALWRANLCTGRWSMKKARERANELRLAFRNGGRPWALVVLLGRKVADAFEYGGEFFTHDAVFGYGSLSLPHPSGLNRLWNAAGAPARARALLRGVAPGVPWGEALTVEQESAGDWDVREPRDS